MHLILLFLAGLLANRFPGVREMCESINETGRKQPG